jgi:hypothetical protein
MASRENRNADGIQAELRLLVESGSSPQAAAADKPRNSMMIEAAFVMRPPTLQENWSAR